MVFLRMIASFGRAIFESCNRIRCPTGSFV